MTEPVQKLFKVPLTVRSLMGRSKAFIVLTTDGEDRFGYYTDRKGKIQSGRIPNYTENGYADLTAQYLDTSAGQRDKKKKEMEQVEDEGEVPELDSQPSDSKSDKKKKKKPAPTEETPTIEGLDTDIHTMTAEFLEEEPKVEQKAPECVSENDRKWFSWTTFKDTMGKMSAGFKYFMDYFNKCLKDAGSHTWSDTVSAMTLQPVIVRTFDVNKRVNKMFKNAGIEGDPAEWFKTHAGTAQCRLVEEKLNSTLAGSSAAMDNLKADMYEVSKKHYRGEGELSENDQFVDKILWDKEATDELRAKLFARAKAIEAELKKDPKNTELSAEYMVYYDAILGLDKGRENLVKFLSKPKAGYVMRQALAKAGKSEEEIEQRMQNMRVLSASYGCEFDDTEPEKTYRQTAADETTLIGEAKQVRAEAIANGQDPDQAWGEYYAQHYGEGGDKVQQPKKKPRKGGRPGMGKSVTKSARLKVADTEY